MYEARLPSKADVFPTMFAICVDTSLKRFACQKEINGLLQRKSGWQDAELTRFTELYRREMQLEQEEYESKAENEVLEKKVVLFVI